MRAGHVISGLGHALLIAWLLFGNPFRPEPILPDAIDVTMVSPEEYAALVLPDEEPPETETEVAQPSTPPTETEPPPPSAETRPEIDASSPDRTGAAPPTEELPEPPERPVAPEAEVIDEAPEPPSPTEEVAVLVPDRPPDPERPPAPRPAPRVAPTPTPEAPPEVNTAPVPEPPRRPDEAAEMPEPETEPAVAEEATTEIVTEAEEPASSAPARALRPRSRPQRLAAAQEEQGPQEPAETSGLEAALSEALASEAPVEEDPAQPPRRPSGQPLTSGEREALRLAIQECWVVDVGSPSANVTVIVGVNMNRDGTVRPDSIRLISAKGGEGRAVEVAFQAARRAILRCQRGGYSLPPEKFDHWREIEITFNPERMRTR